MIAIVTGGAKRIGAQICRRLASGGYRVVVQCHQSVAEGRALAAELCGVCVECDLRDSSCHESLLMAGGESPTLLVNNASVYHRDDFDTMTSQALSEALAVNCLAPVGLMQSFARMASRGASIVNLLDQRIVGIDIHSASYSLAKQCLSNATIMAALSFAPRGIRVNGVAPGYVSPPEGVPMSAMSHLVSQVPLRERTTEEQVAEAVWFLARNASVTGQIIYTDGGLHLHDGDCGEKRAIHHP